MTRTKPPFRADHVGSILRSAAIKDARAKRESGAITPAQLKEIEDREIEKIIRKQEEIGLKLATDGEYRRSWWHFDFFGMLEGVEIYELFPRLAERRHNLGSQLSGGEQQMLAVGRALVLNPRIVLLDEPLEGLAPIIVEELIAALDRIVRQEGMAAILVEQNAHKILGVTDRAVILERGSIVHQGASAALRADRGVLETFLGVTDAGMRALIRSELDDVAPFKHDGPGEVACDADDGVDQRGLAHAVAAEQRERLALVE